MKGAIVIAAVIVAVALGACRRAGVFDESLAAITNSAASTFPAPSLVKRREDGVEVLVRAGYHVLVTTHAKLTADPNDPAPKHR